MIGRNKRTQFHMADSDESYCMVLVQSLSIFSVFPIVRHVWHRDKVKMLYVTSSRIGIICSRMLRKIGLLHSEPLQIVKEDLWPIDTSDNKAHITKTSVCLELNKFYERVYELVTYVIPVADSYYSSLLVANVLKRWADDLYNLERQRLVNYAASIGENAKVDILVVLRSLMVRDSVDKVFKTDDRKNFHVDYQFVLSNTTFFTILHVMRKLVSWIWPSSTNANKFEQSNSVGVTACWGLDGDKENDLFWWQHTGFNNNRLRYLFDRSDFQPSSESVDRAISKGITSIAVNHKARGDVRAIYYRKRVPIKQIVQRLSVVWRILIRSLGTNTDSFSKDIMRTLITEIVSSLYLERQYNSLGLDAFWHYQEAGPDIITTAIHKSGGIRLGVHWSCSDSPTIGSIRTPHVFFFWGAHDARICVDAQSISKQLLIAGCAISDMYDNEAEKAEAKIVADRIRSNGAKVVLVLYDNSNCFLNFYKFFLEWVLEDTNIGILIKPKKRNIRVRHQEIGWLFDNALSTGRMHVLNDSVWPANLAAAGDFCIGIGTMSAVTVSALSGARVVYLDYARLDQNAITKPYAILHSLGPNRCVFHDHGSLRQSVLEYIRDPESNPNLGDATPVLDQIDPFRDGKASQRIGEYMRWYIGYRDTGLKRDNALSQATLQYAEKWGEDKVVRGL